MTFQYTLFFLPKTFSSLNQNLLNVTHLNCRYRTLFASSKTHSTQTKTEIENLQPTQVFPSRLPTPASSQEAIQMFQTFKVPFCDINLEKYL